MAVRPPLSPNPLRNARRHRQQRLLATRSLRDHLISLAGLIHGPVLNQAGQEIGTLADVVARWDGEEPYPPVTGLVVKVGRRDAYITMDDVDDVRHREVRLRSARVDLREFSRRPGEVMLARDVVDHQLVDIDGVQVIRAADLYLAWMPGPPNPAPDPSRPGPPGPVRVLRLVGADVSVQTLLRRLGPKRWRDTPTPERVIDWSNIQPFAGQVRQVTLRSSNEGLHRLRAGELADLLEDLGRSGRQELLASLEPEMAADALEEMDPEELGALLRETPPEQAAELVANMEPDEAVDALRDLDESERDELLEHMDHEQREELEELLEYREDTAGGFMTTNLITATRDATVSHVRQQLREERDHRGDIDAVAVVDDGGHYLGDVSLYDLAIAEDDQVVDGFVEDAEPVTVSAEAELREVASQLTESRRSSVVVVNDEDRPIGRILADDVIDALMPERGRFHFPRLLS
ncbi:MAG TPA: CBS domain-containing protein [Acidimicrobiales bacterium]|jgi:CBS domain-containing protein|nr:CBS domain-containing protein [Acidimicrobiales bacterium]